MIIVKLNGGLGNQMFQYATGLSLAIKLQVPLRLDISPFKHQHSIDTPRKYSLSVFNITATIVSTKDALELTQRGTSLFRKLSRKLRGKQVPKGENYYLEPHYHYAPINSLTQDDIYLDGYWQSYRYFTKYRRQLLTEFTPHKNLTSATLTCLNTIKEQKSSVSLHIRRGDYITNTNANSYHGIASLGYYQKAIDHFTQGLSSPHFFIFSDDLNWAQENVRFIQDVTFVELPLETPDYEEIILMSKCDHNIIANSSFSWWGAWLNQNDNKKVIAPKKWFQDATIDTSDLIPKEWLRL